MRCRIALTGTAIFSDAGQRGKAQVRRVADSNSLRGDGRWQDWRHRKAIHVSISRASREGYLMMGYEGSIGSGMFGAYILSRPDPTKAGSPSLQKVDSRFDAGEWVLKSSADSVSSVFTQGC